MSNTTDSPDSSDDNRPHGQNDSPVASDERNASWTGKPADRANASDAELGRAREAGLNTDARGGPGSAARANGADDGAASQDAGLNDEVSTEPRSNTRLPSLGSQGLTGAQGSGGAPERNPHSNVAGGRDGG